MKDILDPSKKDKLWNQRQVQSIAQQAITQGKSIYEIRKDIQNILGERNHKAAIRNARTLMTLLSAINMVMGQLIGETVMYMVSAGVSLYYMMKAERTLLGRNPGI